MKSLTTLFLLFLLLHFVDSLVIPFNNATKKIQWLAPMRPFTQELNGGFGMTIGGSVNVDLQVKRLTDNPSSKCFGVPPLHIYVLTSLQHKQIPRECFDNPTPSGPVCWDFINSTKKFSIPITKSNASTLKTSSPIGFLSKFQVFVVNPCEFEYFVAGSVDVKNSWGHLDVAEQYYPEIYMTALVVYIGIAVFWFPYVIANKQYVILQHYLLSLLIVLRIGQEAVYYVIVRDYNLTGKRDRGTKVFHGFLNDLYEVTGLFFFLLISMGYKLYRDDLDIRQMRLVIGSTLTYAVVCFSQELFCLLPQYCHFVILFRFILRSFLLVGIIALLNALISSVKASVRQITVWQESVKSSYLLLRAHKHLRRLFYAYVILPTCIFALRVSVFDWTEFWVESVMSDLVVKPIIEMCILYAIRPAPFCVHVPGIL